jgi:anti-sigma-K factor RskA
MTDPRPDSDPTHDSGPTHDSVRDLLAAYLLDAVEEDERMLVEEHLLACPDCERDLAALEPTVEALALAPAPVAPPARVREAVLRGIAPAVSSGPADASTAGPFPADDLAARRDARSTRRLSLLVAVAAAIALFMFVAIGPFRGAPDVTTETVAAAADAQRFEAEVGEATATVIVSRELDRVAIETRDMTPAPEGRDYQLWFSHPDGTVTDAGVMPREEDAAMVLSDELGDAVGVAVTLEPEGGSSQPTTEPVVVVPFEA